MLTAVSPAVLTRGQSATVTLTGAATNFVQGTTQLTAGQGITVGTLTVSSATTLTVQLTAAANATIGPRTLLVTTGAEEALSPNGLGVRE